MPTAFFECTRTRSSLARSMDSSVGGGIRTSDRLGATFPPETAGCSGMTAWRRLRGWTEAGVWTRLHAVDELRRAGLLDPDDCAVDGLQSGRPKGGSHRLLAR
ncbi:hypothetical protein SUDANB108_00056 [Streptomyces sp. enrichment culture]